MTPVLMAVCLLTGFALGWFTKRQRLGLLAENNHWLGEDIEALKGADLDADVAAERRMRLSSEQPAVAKPVELYDQDADPWDFIGIRVEGSPPIRMTGVRDTDAQDRELTEVYGIEPVTPQPEPGGPGPEPRNQGERTACSTCGTDPKVCAHLVASKGMAGCCGACGTGSTHIERQCNNCGKPPVFAWKRDGFPFAACNLCISLWFEDGIPEWVERIGAEGESSQVNQVEQPDPCPTCKGEGGGMVSAGSFGDFDWEDCPDCRGDGNDHSADDCCPWAECPHPDRCDTGCRWGEEANRWAEVIHSEDDGPETLPQVLPEGRID